MTKTSALGLTLALLGCGTAAPSASGPRVGSTATPTEVRVTNIPLSGEILREDSEVSGLAWFGDQLILLPQFPDRFQGSDGQGVVFVLDRSEVEAHLDGGAVPTMSTLPIDFRGVAARAPGFEGFEAIAFVGDRFALTVEADSGEATLSYLVTGEVLRVAGEAPLLRVDPSSLVQIENQTGVDNLAYEALVAWEGSLVLLHEYNGQGNPSRHAVRVAEWGAGPVTRLGLSELSYRLTDASAADDSGRFWVTNYFWEGEEWDPGSCDLRARYGDGPTHLGSRRVERLVELQLNANGVTVSERPPIMFELESDRGRNWEGIARLGARGLLMVTDQHPSTMLAFVPL